MPEFIGRWLLFVCLNLLAAANATLAVLDCHSSYNEVVGFLSNWFTFFLGQIVLVETALGLLGWLTSWNILMVLGIISAVLVLWRRGQGRPRIPLQQIQELESAVSFLQHKREAGVVIFLAVWVVAGIGVAALAEVSTLPDSLAYHLPEAVNWIHARSLVRLQVSWADMANSYFPSSGGLLYFWMLAPFRNDLLVRLTNLFMWLVLGIGFFRLSRMWGASGEASLAATLLLLFTPMVLAQTNETSLDLASTAVFLLALGHLAEFARSRQLESVVLFSLAAGLFLGIKYSAPAYLLLLAVIFVLLLVLMLRHHQISGRVALSYGCIFALGIAALGGYGYIRNFVLTGNPVYPMQVSLGGYRLPGVYSSSFYHFNQIGWRWRDIPLPLLAEGIWQGAGFLFPLMVVVSIFWLRRAIFNKPEGVRLAWLAGLVGVTLIIFLNTPYSIMVYSPNESIMSSSQLAVGMRLGMIACSLYAVLVAWGISFAPDALRVLWLVLGPAIVQTVFSSWDKGALWGKLASSTQLVVAGMMVTIVAFGVWLLRRALSAIVRSPRRFVPLIVVATLLAGVGLSAVEQYRERFRYGVYQSVYGDIALDWKWIDENIRGAKIVMAGSNQSYPLYGSYFQNQVRFIELTDRPDAYEIWLRNLADWQAQYLVLIGTSKEKQWATEHTDVFSLIFKGKQIRLYQIRQ